MSEWTDGMGFIVCIGAWAAYLVGLFIAIVCDIRPKNRLKHKLFKDFRNIDRFGLRPYPEENENFDEIMPSIEDKIEKGKNNKGKYPKGKV